MRERAESQRQELRETFDRAVDLYQRARPEYPAELFDHLIAATGLQPGDRLLEIGCASGKATLPLARRGFRITCVELGTQLAAAARRNLAPFPDVHVIERRFEEWAKPIGLHFDLVFAATAWHWIDPSVRYVKAWEALRPAGHLAFWEAVHVFPEGGDPFFLEIQDVYDEIGEVRPAEKGWPRPGELEERRSEIEAAGLFDIVEVRHFDWERTYDAEGYIDLLQTFSGYVAMQQWPRDRLYGEIRQRLDQRPGHTVPKAVGWCPSHRSATRLKLRGDSLRRHGSAVDAHLCSRLPIPGAAWPVDQVAG